MADKLTKERRSENMRRIRSKDTSIEKQLRSALWKLNQRGYRIHPKHVTGKPDLVFNQPRVAVFIDGCFWHGCEECYVLPKSNTTYWSTKLLRNRNRDVEVKKLLRRDGWLVVRMWEHEVERDVQKAAHRVLRALRRRSAK